MQTLSNPPFTGCLRSFYHVHQYRFILTCVLYSCWISEDLFLINKTNSVVKKFKADTKYKLTLSKKKSVSEKIKSQTKLERHWCVYCFST